jgi:DNA-binding NarL/FixJ family response regulator
VPIRIMVVDDHPVIHDGLRYLAAKTPDIEFCGGAMTGQELETLLHGMVPDILLLDVNLSGENGLALCRRIKDRYPEIQILIISAFSDAHLLQKSVRAGASGYALKSVSMATLPGAIRQLRQKGTFFSSELSALVLETLGEPDGRNTGANAREDAIIRLIAQGLTNAEIAGELAVSVHTIKFHVSRLLQNYGCRRRSELVKLILNARDNGEARLRIRRGGADPVTG